MRSIICLLFTAAKVLANPFPQGVTANIAPSASAPSGCMGSYSGIFGVAVMSITASSSAAVATQSSG